MRSQIHTKKSLIAFEAEVAELFNSGQIRAPIHLSGGNEEELINYFNHIFQPGDWVVSTWRSHYHALLAGVPPTVIKTAILLGRSITLCFPDYRFFSSAIVGGHLPIGLGIALAIKRSGGNNQVHAFLGDMAAHGGVYHEVRQYAAGHDLPIRFVVEDNGKSVMTNTKEVWKPGFAYELRYRYELPWPHAGAGVRVQF